MPAEIEATVSRALGEDHALAKAEAAEALPARGADLVVTGDLSQAKLHLRESSVPLLLVGRARESAGLLSIADLGWCDFVSASASAAELRLRAGNLMRAAQVEAKRKAVEQASAELESDLQNLAYAVSHDLRAPLRTVRGFSDIVMSDYADRLDELGNDYLQRISSGAQRMADMLDDLVLLSRSALRPLEPALFDLSAALSRRAGEMRAEQPDRPMDIQIDANLQVHGDSELLRLAFAHLLENSWKFTRDRNPAVIRVSGRLCGSFLEVSVSDNGAGFDPLHAKQLFRPFGRLHANSSFAGRGIGLALVKRIVHRHGGEVSATATPDRGATFVVRLPAANLPDASRGTDQAAQADGGSLTCSS